jgi:hypothetical protein
VNSNDGGISTTSIFIWLIALVIWSFALYVLIKYWNKIPTLSKYLGVIFLISGIGGPILTIIIVYISKDNHSIYSEKSIKN